MTNNALENIITLIDSTARANDMLPIDVIEAIVDGDVNEDSDDVKIVKMIADAGLTPDDVYWAIDERS
jgi:hypothetical protein